MICWSGQVTRARGHVMSGLSEPPWVEHQVSESQKQTLNNKNIVPIIKIFSHFQGVRVSIIETTTIWNVPRRNLTTVQCVPVILYIVYNSSHKPM